MGFAIGRFAVRHAVTIVFLVIALCVGGVYAARHTPSAVFPQTDFPRVIIIVENGVMPADEMMATITRPVEEAMKDIPACTTVRSSTGRGTAEIDVFFTWQADMPQSELYVSSRLSQVRGALPATVSTSVYRMNFAVFPIVGISLTSPSRDLTRLWETASQTIKPRFLRIPGVAKVDLVGGRPPEYRVTVDPARLAALHLSLPRVVDTLANNNLVAPAGMHQQDYNLYLTVVDGRLASVADIEDLTVTPEIAGNGTGAGPANVHPIPIKDFARVDRGPEPAFSVVTAQGSEAVLLNIYSQSDGSTLEIIDGVKRQLREVGRELPPDMKLTFFYDQSIFVRNAVNSVWEAIGFGLVLSVVIIYLFLRDWGTTLVATVVIPVTVLFTILAMKLSGQSFNLMTLGGIAAAIGLVIDDAIVVVEAIQSRVWAGMARTDAVVTGIGEIFTPLLGSTLTPVVVFIPLAFLSGISGVFFRALAITMVVGLLTSLLLALTLTPSLAAWMLRRRRELGDALASNAIPVGSALRTDLPVSEKMVRSADPTEPVDRAADEEIDPAGTVNLVYGIDPVERDQSGFAMRLTVGLYEVVLRLSLRHKWFTVALCILVLAASAILYGRLKTDFLPAMDEGGFVIDYIAPPGTSLAEINRQLLVAEDILRKVPEVESYSRRTGQALGVHLVEPNTGDFLVKLKPKRDRTTSNVIDDLRQRFEVALPAFSWDFPGILSDLIGDLSWTDTPIEVKLYSNDTEYLKKKAPQIESKLKQIKGVVDTNSGVTLTGPSISLRVRYADAQRRGLSTADIADAVNTAMLGKTASTVLEADRVVNVRVKADPESVDQIAKLGQLPLRAADGTLIRLDQVTDLIQTPGQLELERDDLRQDVSITASLEDRDLGSAMADVRKIISQDKTLAPGSIEFGGLYQQQQESFANLLVVLIMAVVLVFTVALAEFRSFAGPIAIVFGAVLGVFGIILALLLTGTTVSIITLLGAIIGVGVVHKNGILMLDYVEHLRGAGLSLHDALVQSGRRRLRPVLMTSLAAALGMLPLAYGIGSGADMLKPLAIAVIGAVCVSALLSLVATPTAYYLLLRIRVPVNPEH